MAWRQVTAVRVRHVEYSDEVLRDKRRERRVLAEQLERLAKLEESSLRRLDEARKKLANERLKLPPPQVTRSRPVSIGSLPLQSDAAAAGAAQVADRGEGGAGREAAAGGAGGVRKALSRSRRISCPPPPSPSVTNGTPFSITPGGRSGLASSSSSKESSLNSSGSR